MHNSSFNCGLICHGWGFLKAMYLTLTYPGDFLNEFLRDVFWVEFCSKLKLKWWLFLNILAINLIKLRNCLNEFNEILVRR